MNILLALLRLLHIVSGVAWVGLGLASAVYIAPTAIAAGEGGLRFLKALLTRTNFGNIFATVGGMTMLAGILLYAFGDIGGHLRPPASLCSA
jgi:hypothetical protein